jgi:hypothetical protein
MVGGPESPVGFFVGIVGLRIGVLEGRSTERGSGGGGQIGKRSRTDGGEERRAICGSLLAIDGTHGKAEYLRL